MRNAFRWLTVFALVGAVVGLAFAADDKPFPGKYELIGDASALAAGDKIVVEEFVTPLCAQCFLYHRELKAGYGDDVEVKYTYVFHGDDGIEPVRLLLLARLANPAVEEKLLKVLFDANFEKKAPIKDDDVLGALAAANGLGAQWSDPAWKAKVDGEIKKIQARFDKMGSPPKTPRIEINGVIATSPGIAGCQGDELTPVVLDIVKNVRAYRKGHGK